VSSPARRVEIAAGLRAEAHRLLAESGLFTLLAEHFAEPIVTGSAGYDLMVWRDIDIHMAVEPERWDDWLQFGLVLARHFDRLGLPLHRASYSNDWIEPGPLGSGLHWDLALHDRERRAWQIGLTGWDPFDYAVRQARDFALRTDLAACDRDLILRLKTEARARPDYYDVRVTSHDIYEFCIAGVGDSLSALEMWKKRH
jgi:hypothetical protein